MNKDQPPPPASGLPVSPCRAEELAAWLESFAHFGVGDATARDKNLIQSATLLRAQQATIDRLQQLVSERTDAMNDFEQKTIKQQAEPLALQADKARLDWLANECYFPDGHPEKGLFMCARKEAIPHGGYGINAVVNARVIRAAIDAALHPASPHINSNEK